MRNLQTFSFLRRRPELFKQRRAAALQRVEVGRLVVGGTRLPAAVKNADPLEGQGPHCSLMGASLGALLTIIGAGPEGLVNRLRRPFHKCLPQERGAPPAPVYPATVAAALGDRSDAGILLELVGAGEALALFA